MTTFSPRPVHIGDANTIDALRVHTQVYHPDCLVRIKQPDGSLTSVRLEHQIVDGKIGVVLISSPL